MVALARKLRSVVEEEDERGVAHIVEHLAFSATSRYTNHDIVKFLESIGAEFGACQNALTSSDETIYELLVPVDKPGLLSQAISVLADFSSEVRMAFYCCLLPFITSR
jgi:predicted Zn-dependent peptidase